MAADLYHFPIDSAEIRRELYSLMALLFADEKMAELAERQQGFARLSSDVLRTVLPLKFLTVAAAVRGAVDGITADNQPYMGGGCGDYFHSGQNAAEDLSLRKACSKVIHAKRTLFYPEETAKSGVVVFNGKITLYQRLNKKRPGWKAEIDLEKFAAECLVALDKADEVVK